VVGGGAKIYSKVHNGYFNFKLRENMPRSGGEYIPRSGGEYMPRSGGEYTPQSGGGECRRREAMLGGYGGMPPRKILKNRGS